MIHSLGVLCHSLSNFGVCLIKRALLIMHETNHPLLHAAELPQASGSSIGLKRVISPPTPTQKNVKGNEAVTLDQMGIAFGSRTGL